MTTTGENWTGVLARRYLVLARFLEANDGAPDRDFTEALDDLIRAARTDERERVEGEWVSAGTIARLTTERDQLQGPKES